MSVMLPELYSGEGAIKAGETKREGSLVVDEKMSRRTEVR